MNIPAIFTLICMLLFSATANAGPKSKEINLYFKYHSTSAVSSVVDSIAYVSNWAREECDDVRVNIKVYGDAHEKNNYPFVDHFKLLSDRAHTVLSRLSDHIWVNKFGNKIEKIDFYFGENSGLPVPSNTREARNRLVVLRLSCDI